MKKYTINIIETKCDLHNLFLSNLRWHTLAIGICDDIGFTNDRKSYPVAHWSTYGVVHCHSELEKVQINIVLSSYQRCADFN